jgi:glycerol-3-phosphate acyltransferase PlsY
VAIGHCFSPGSQFKGGKTVACFMGMTGGTSWFGLHHCLAGFLTDVPSRSGSSPKPRFDSGAILCAYEWLMYLLCSLTGFDSGILLEFRLWRRTPRGLVEGWESATFATIVYVLVIGTGKTLNG